MVVSTWRPFKKSVVVLYFYTAVGKYELSLNIGDQLQVEEETEGWYKGYLIKSATSSPNKKGIFPKSYVKIVEGLTNVDTDVVLSHIHQALSEWGSMFKLCFKEGKMTQFHGLKERMSLLLEVRRQIMSTSTTSEIRETLKSKALDKVEEVRALMGQDITPKNSKGEIADESNSGIIALYHLHHQQEENAKKANKVPALRVVKTEENEKSQKNIDKKNRKKAKQEMRKSVAFARAQLIGMPDAEGELASQPDLPLHILFDLRILMCPVGDPAELYFSLYNGARSDFVSEEYLVLMTSQGMPQDLNKLGKLKTLFADVSLRDLYAGDLYLVMRIVKRTKASDDPKKSVRRPFGVAVLGLGPKGSDPVLILNKEVEHTFPVFAPTSETTFPAMPDLILKNNFQVSKNGPLAEVPNSKGVCVAMTLLQGNISSLLVPEGLCTTNRKALPDVLALNYLRNDLYLTLVGGEFVKDKVASVKNVQAVISVRNGAGEVIGDSIFQGSGTSANSEADSLVFFHTNSPNWDELFWLHYPSPISLDWYNDKWLFVQLYHHGEKGKDKEEFAQAFLKLSKDGGPVIDDGVHTLTCYKPASPAVPSFTLKEEAKAGIRKGEHIKIKVQLTATELTSNTYIYSLLRWKLNNTGIEDVLKRFTFIEPAEIVKFMGDVCSTIFEIMEVRENLSLLSFDAFVFIVGLGPKVVASLDKYLANRFHAPYVHRSLLSCLKHYLTQQGDPITHSKMLSTFKSLAYVFKFIISSRVLYNKKLAGELVNKNDPLEKRVTPIQNDTFIKDMLEVFELFNELMKSNVPQMRGPQSSALKNISSIFGDLQAIFSKPELSTIIARFVQSVQYAPQLELLNKEKLILLNKLVCGSPLFLDKASLDILLPPVLYQIGLHLKGSHHDEILQSILILSVIANTFQTKVKVEDSIILVLEHLPAVMGAVRTLREEVDFAGVPAVCLLAILKISSRAVFERYLASLGGWEVQEEFLTDLFTLLHEMLAGSGRNQTQLPTAPLLSPSAPSSPRPPRAAPAATSTATTSSSPLPLLSLSQSLPVTTTPFPSHWLFINMFAYGTVLKITDYISDYVIRAYKTELSNTTKVLWERILGISLVFLRTRPLAMESFPPLKRNLVLERYSDMRNPMSQILLRVWGALRAADQMKFLVDLIGPALYLMMMDPVFIQDTGIKLYYALLELEVKETKSIKMIEALTIDTLDACAYEGTLPKHFNTFFVSRLQAAFAESKSEILVQTGKKFISDITYLLDLLADLSDLPTSPTYEDERVEAIVKLMDYLKATGRTTSYLKYVHMLESIHAASGNFGEAGHTILLHAELMKWEEDIVESVGIFPRETSRQRKERLYKVALDYFDKGKLWEEAIKLIKELRVEYEFTLYDYQKLAEILDMQATLVRKISTIERFFPDYFRVGYYGKGFDAKYQNKEYVFRGLELEGRPEFVTRMQLRFPDANFLNYTEPPPEDILTSSQQHIQVFNVKTALAADETVNPDMPQSISKYHQLNNRKMFWYSKPFRKKKTGNDFKDLWLRNFIYHTSDKLPGIHRRTEIIKNEQVELSPLRNAVNAVEAKNIELAQLARKFEMGHDDGKGFSLFSMTMVGAIDAAVNGGIDVYANVFVSAAYLQEAPEDEALVRQLLGSIQAQVVLLERGLTVHRRFCDISLVPLQERMEQQYAKTKSNFENLAMPVV